MKEDQDQHHLEMRPVGLEHLAQFNELLRYVFQVTAQDIQESGYEEGAELQRAKRPVLRQADVFGWFDKEQLISQVAIYPCEVNIHGKRLKMAGLTGVGTYPEYANGGLMHQLLQTALEKMRANQQYISYLFPYSIPYYKRKGWEIISDKIDFVLKDTQLPKEQEVPGYVHRLELDHEDVHTVYEAFAQQNHGALFRDDLAWEEYWRWENEEDRIAAVYYDANDQPQGLLFYWIAEDVFHMKEMIYCNQEARKGLWNFVTAHFSMVEKVEGQIFKNEPLAFLLEDSEIEESIRPYFMARIVDVAAFLRLYPFQTLPQTIAFHFKVEDPMAPWNNGIFGVAISEGSVKIQPGEALGEAVSCSIQTLTTMLMSYRSPSYLAKIERLTASAQTIQLLERIIPQETPYFSDYF